MNTLIEQINDILQQMQKENQNLRPIMVHVAGMVAQMINKNFVAKGRWDGNAYNISILSGGNQRWKPLSSGYKERVLEKYNSADPTLYRTGALKRSIEVNPTKTGIEITANTPYAKKHQLGSRIVTKNATINMPPRPYLTITKDELKDILGFISSYVLRA